MITTKTQTQYAHFVSFVNFVVNFKTLGDTIHPLQILPQGQRIIK